MSWQKLREKETRDKRQEGKQDTTRTAERSERGGDISCPNNSELGELALQYKTAGGRTFLFYFKSFNDTGIQAI